MGSFTAMVASSPFSYLKKLRAWVRIFFTETAYDSQGIIRTLVEFSEKARKEGLLSLDENLDQVEDNFLRSGMRLVVDGTDPDIIKSILYNDLSQMEARHQEGVDFFEKWSAIAPTFGLVGTLVGLIALLRNLEDKSALGASMGVALIATFYGTFFANMFFGAVSRKLEIKSREEVGVRELIIEGILSIQAGDNPRILEQKLLSFVQPSQRKSLLDSSEG